MDSLKFGREGDYNCNYNPLEDNLCLLDKHGRLELNLSKIRLKFVDGTSTSLGAMGFEFQTSLVAIESDLF